MEQTRYLSENMKRFIRSKKRLVKVLFLLKMMYYLLKEATYYANRIDILLIK